jgi:hypothetical protein
MRSLWHACWASAARSTGRRRCRARSRGGGR